MYSLRDLVTFTCAIQLMPHHRRSDDGAADGDVPRHRRSGSGWGILGIFHSGTLCHHMADLASQWLSSTVTPEDIRRHFTSCMPNLNAMCKDLLCQTYSNTKLLASS